MTNLPPVMLELLGDPDGKRAEECLLALIADLEKSGLKKRAIARAMARVLLGFCAENGRKVGNFGWASSVLSSTGEALEKRVWQARRRWVKRFMTRTGRLYRDASLMVEIDDSHSVVEAVNARLGTLHAQGQA